MAIQVVSFLKITKPTGNNQLDKGGHQVQDGTLKQDFQYGSGAVMLQHPRQNETVREMSSQPLPTTSPSPRSGT